MVPSRLAFRCRRSVNASGKSCSQIEFAVSDGDLESYQVPSHQLELLVVLGETPQPA